MSVCHQTFFEVTIKWIALSQRTDAFISPSYSYNTSKLINNSPPAGPPAYHPTSHPTTQRYGGKNQVRGGKIQTKTAWRGPLRERCADGLLIVEAQVTSPHTIIYTRHGGAISDVSVLRCHLPYTKVKAYLSRHTGTVWSSGGGGSGTGEGARVRGAVRCGHPSVL